MIFENIYCEKCNGEVGSLKGEYVCKECGHPLSTEAIQGKLTAMFEKHKPKETK